MTQDRVKPPLALTHRGMFLIGWLHYIGLPIILGYAGVYESSDMFGPLVHYFDIDNQYWPYFIIYSILALIAYWLGSLWAPLSNVLPKQLNPVKKLRIDVMCLVPIYFSLMLFFTWNSSAYLGAGYTEGIDISVLGPLCTLEMILLFHYLNERFVGTRVTTGAYVLLLTLCSLVLLSMGARLAVLSAIVSIYFQWWNWGGANRTAQIKSLKVLAIIPLILTVIGMWRQNDLGFDLTKALYYLVGEPIGTAISGITVFTGGRWDGLIDFPEAFLVNFYNIVPTMFWSDKAAFLSELLANINDKFEQPFGATSIIASSVGYFGFLGGSIFFLLVGAFMTAVGRIKNFYSKTYYCFLVGLLPFIFFRDPFQGHVKYIVTGLLMCFVVKILRPTSKLV
jgi:hypothetical protein